MRARCPSESSSREYGIGTGRCHSVFRMRTPSPALRDRKLPKSSQISRRLAANIAGNSDRSRLAERYQEEKFERSGLRDSVSPSLRETIRRGSTRTDQIDRMTSMNASASG